MTSNGNYGLIIAFSFSFEQLTGLYHRIPFKAIPIE